MVWCKKSFQQSFSDDHCCIFPTQHQLFEFLDERKSRGADSPKWLPFSIEFPSELDVIQSLSRRSNNGTLFKKSSINNQKSKPSEKRSSSQVVREDYCLLYGETPLSAQRRMFLAATLDGIRLILETISPLQLHLYEVIRESTSCHLYFDVERSSNHVCRQEEIDLDSPSCASEASDDEVVVCSKQKNDILVATVQSNHGPRTFRYPVSDYERLLRSTSGIPSHLCPLTCAVLPDGTHTEEVLLSELSTFVAKYYPFLQPEGLLKQSPPSIESVADTVLVLRSVSLGTDANAAQKFSQHYVVKLHRHVFDSNTSAGEFVRQFVEHLQTRCGKDPEVHRALFYHGAPVIESLTPCSTGSQSCPTLPLFPRRCIIDTAVYSRNRTMRCLGSCKLGKDSVLKLESVLQNGKPVNFKKNSLFENFISSLIVAHDWISPPAADDRILLHIEGWSGTGRSTLAKLGVKRHIGFETAIGPPYFFSDTEHADGLSAISRIEAGYGDICGCKCSITSTRRVGDRYVILSLGGTRYCQNIMREHKSNNVYLVVDLVKRTWVQKCFDPDCLNYRSQAKAF